jgi:hypothetical protein
VCVPAVAEAGKAAAAAVDPCGPPVVDPCDDSEYAANNPEICGTLG